MKKKFVIMLVLMCVALQSCGLRPADGSVTDKITENDTSDTLPVQAEPEDVTTEAEADTTVSSLSFVACGDNIVYFGTYRDAAAQAFSGGRQYNFKPIYENVQSTIASADISFINQETVISQSSPVESYPTFNSPVDLSYDLEETGFDIINVANNHMLDKGALGLRETFDNWKTRNVTLIGCYEEQTDPSYITYYEKNGIKIAFVSYTYGTNLSEDPANQGLYAPYLRSSDVAGDVAKARANSDFVIVSVHWGDEGSLTANDEQKQYAKTMADSGADVIIGHHPHVLQPVEWITGKDGNKTLCVYSLGNFVAEQSYYYNAVGGMISFNIEKTGSNHAVCASPVLTPTVCHFPANFYNNKVYFLRDYTDELANAHAVKTYYHNDMSLASLKKLVADTIPAEFLPDYMK